MLESLVLNIIVTYLLIIFVGIYFVVSFHQKKKKVPRLDLI